MTQPILRQSEADALLLMEKRRADEAVYTFSTGCDLCMPLVSLDGRHEFLMDVDRTGNIYLRTKYQTRAYGDVVLARLDINGPPHRNPDGTEMPCPHLHVYREGFADKWASAPPSSSFSDLEDVWLALQQFMAYCGVVEPPSLQRGLL